MKTAIQKKATHTIFLVLFFTVVAAQPQNNHWFFASGNGISFSSGSPVNIPGGKHQRMEGGSTVSDKNGQLLFYSDGYLVWDRKHDIMPNGVALYGGYASSTQSCLIVPKTANEKEYYIFTADEESGPNGLSYSIVDMSLNNGYGAVTKKNIQLVGTTSEKITAIRHCNKKDYWIVTHKIGSNAFYSFLASDTGVNMTPVISNVGSVIPYGNYVMAGVLKSSPDGKKVIAQQLSTGSELFDFNNQTGQLSNGVEIFGNANAAHYSAEFSANSSKLYLGISSYWDDAAMQRLSGVFQYDLSLPTMTDIINSKIQLHRYDTHTELGIMQRGPDKKIYMSQYEKAYLSVIHSPEIAGTGCNFVSVGFSLPRKGMFGLNNAINDFSTRDSLAFNSTGLCTNSPINFDYVMTGDINAVLWDFGDPASGSLNSSTQANATHTYASAGLYTVKLITYGICGNDTATKNINIGGLTVDLGQDQNFCENSTVLLNPQSGNANSFLWDDGSTMPTLSTAVPGIHWVQVSSNSNSCIKRDSILLIAKPVPFVDLGRDSVLCIGQSLQLDAKNAGSEFRWQDNSTQQYFTVNGGGKYWVQVDLNGCKKADTIVITNGYKPQFTLGPDQYLCPGVPLQLNPNYQGTNYTWQDGSTSPTYTTNKTGIYHVEIMNNCGSASDSITVFNGTCKLYIPTGFTPNNNGRNDLFQIGGGELITEFDMRVFDRAGQLVFATQNKNTGWNGKLNGSDMPTGVYIYLVRYKELNDPQSKMRKGTVLLIR